MWKRAHWKTCRALVTSVNKEPQRRTSCVCVSNATRVNVSTWLFGCFCYDAWRHSEITPDQSWRSDVVWLRRGGCMGWLLLIVSYLFIYLFYNLGWIILFCLRERVLTFTFSCSVANTLQIKNVWKVMHVKYARFCEKYFRWSHLPKHLMLNNHIALYSY